MPQLILEYSSNILEKDNLSDVLKKINKFLSETLPTELASCKSRSIEYDSFVVGDGDPKNAFVHINLKVMPGRSIDKLNKLGQEIIGILKEYFHTSADQLNLQITLEIDEIQKTYFKYVS